MKIKAAVLYEMGAPAPYSKSQPLHVEELTLDPPGEQEVVVEIKAAGLCHSDLSVINGDRPRPTPMALGHEAAGVVVELGRGVTDLTLGDHVVLVFVPSCGRCLPCAQGRPALCEPGAKANGAGTLLSGARRLHRANREVHHHLGVSAFSTFVVAARQSLVKVDPTLPLEEAALFGCAVVTGVGAVVNTAKVEPGATVAIVGLGGVGLAALLGARVSGAERIVAIDLLPAKLEIARSLGATDVFNAGSSDCVAQVREATKGGVDYAFEVVGSMPAMELAYAITRRGGTTVSSGVAHPDKKFSFQHISLVGEERTIKGSYVGSCIPTRDIPRFIALYRRGLLPVDKLLSARIGFSDLNAAFDQLAAGQAIRQVLIPQ